MPRLIEATRVQIVCPSGSLYLRIATNEIVRVLLLEENIQKWGGITYSSVAPPVFVGQFWNKPEVGDPWWDEDLNVIITIDIPGEPLPNVLSYFGTLRDRVSQVYEDLGQPQKLIWITFQAIEILLD